MRHPIIPAVLRCAALAAVAWTAALTPPGASAGGFLSVSGAGTPRAWTASPIVLRYDAGPLSAAVNKATADTMVNNAVARWNTANIPTCSLTFSQGADLAVDHGTTTAPASNPNYNEGSPDGITPVIYDQNGFLTGELFAGAEQVIIGFAGPAWLSGNTITEGQAVLNGLFIDGISGGGNPADLSSGQYEGVITHEIGHMLNLDHAQANREYVNSVPPSSTDFTGYPSMFPLVHAGIQTLELDDRVWISELYPTASHTALTAITGETRDNSNARVNGVNIIARSATNPLDVITCVSGYRDGSPGTINASAGEAVYRIPGLATGSRWVVNFEQISPNFTSGSRVGPIDPPLVVPGPAEFLNESGIEGTSDDVKRSTTFATPGTPGGVVSGVDLRLNSFPSAQNINEVDPGSSFPSAAMALTTINPGQTLNIAGNLNPAEGGNVSFIGDPIEDWYVIQPASAYTIRRITLTPHASDDADLYLCSFNQPASSLLVVSASLTDGVGLVEEIVGPYDAARFGAGTAAGLVYIGVSTFTGFPGGDYTLTIEADVSNTSALVVDAVTGGQIDVGSGTMTITGRGFRNTGGAPTVTTTDPNISIGTVTFVNANTLDVAISGLMGFTPGNATLEVTNQSAGGGFAGRLPAVATIPVSLSAFDAE